MGLRSIQRKVLISPQELSKGLPDKYSNVALIAEKAKGCSSSRTEKHRSRSCSGRFMAQWILGLRLDGKRGWLKLNVQEDLDELVCETGICQAQGLEAGW